MSQPGATELLEAPLVGRDRKNPPDKAGKGKDTDKPERARDKGEVKPLGVEILASLYDALDKRRKAKKWSKRSAVEEALRDWLTKEGVDPPPEES